MKISIITATYNSGETLRDTLDSVLSPSYFDYEHIIIDGCSKDNTLDIVKEYEPRYNGRLKWVSEKDKGLYDAMNKGISMATGDVIGILNSDDFYTSKDVLMKIVEKMSDSTLDAVYGDIHFVNPQNINRCVRYYSSKHFKRWKLRFGYMPPHPSFYCRTSVFLQYGSFETCYKTAADYDIIVRFIYKARIQTKYINMDFVTMRIGGASTSGLGSYKVNIKERLIALRNNHIYSNYLFLALSYPSKIFQVIKTKFIYW
jgi:glycosyltransferase involved in cell wall biosynthesis